MSAIDELSGAELSEGETLDLQIGDRTTQEAVAFAHALPPEVLMAGLQAMRLKLEEML